MSEANQPAICLKEVSKFYKLYSSPKERFVEALHPFGRKYYQEFYALQDINMTVGRGEIVGVVGENGSGKSTLLKLISSVLVPSSGTVQVNGVVSALLELGSGFNPEFTGLQNIYFLGTVMGFAKEEMNDRVHAITEFADIGKFIHQPVKMYSSGMKSRLGFAIAINVDPDILILDEVLAVGDDLFRRKCFAVMEKFFAGGKTVLYVSHDVNSVNRFCSRAIYLHDGNILLDAEAKITTKYYQKKLFAKDANQEEILNEIREVSKVVEQGEKAEVASNDGSSQQEKTRRDSTPTESYYIPDFVSDSMVVYNEDNLKISSIYIKNKKEKKVNALYMNEKYRLCYTIHLLQPEADLVFGMTIKTEQGVIITTSGSLGYGQKIEAADEGTAFSVEWEFLCSMYPGNFFIDVGVKSLVDGEGKFLNRVVDAYAFKVLPSNIPGSGIVNLMQAPLCKKVNNR